MHWVLEALHWSHYSFIQCLLKANRHKGVEWQNEAAVHIIGPSDHHHPITDISEVPCPKTQQVGAHFRIVNLWVVGRPALPSAQKSDVSHSFCFSSAENVWYKCYLLELNSCIAKLWCRVCCHYNCKCLLWVDCS